MSTVMDFKVGDRVKYSEEYLKGLWSKAREQRGSVEAIHIVAMCSLLRVKWNTGRIGFYSSVDLAHAEPEILQGVPLDPPVPCERELSEKARKACEWRRRLDVFEDIGECGDDICAHGVEGSWTVYRLHDQWLQIYELSGPDEIQSAVAGLYALREGV